MTQTNIRSLLFCLILQIGATPAIAAAEEDADEDDFLPGLVGRYSVGEKSIERIDPDVQFTWRTGMPDQRLPGGYFSARWTGKLLARSEGKHALHLYLQGEASVSIGGREVVRGQRTSPSWVAGDVFPLEGGEPTIEIAYRQTAPVAIIRLFWSSESFPLEPLPAQALFHEGRRPDLAQIERGRDLYAAHRCHRCHGRERETPAPDAPHLKWAALGLSRDWLADWVRGPSSQIRHARMPSFGLTRDEAQAVAEFLVSQAAAFDETFPEVADRASESRRGEALFRSVGCLACHTRDDLGQQNTLGGGDLTDVGKRRSGAWLSTWLKEPQRLNPVHRMPVFALTEEERRDLVIYLCGPGPTRPGSQARPGSHGAAKLDAKLVETGRRLVAQARCTACHRDDQAPADLSGISRLDEPVGDWSRACIEADSDPKHRRPVYRFSEADRQALRAYVDTHAGLYSFESPHEAARRLLRRNNCLSCHQRDGGKGIGSIALAASKVDPDLAGQTEALIPPDLTAVGDKLQDAFLSQAVVGAQSAPRLPWLRVRMPRFGGPQAGNADLSQFFIDHDRIPENGPQTPFAEPAKPLPPAEIAEFRSVGRVLAGMRGFSCVACHKVGGFEPRNVALATRGSDLYGMAQRMRPEFFTRWVRAPLRVIPNMEMPSFDKPHRGLLDDRLDAQLAAMWAALNDPKGPPQLDTSKIEQVLVVGPNDPPLIVRDVFNMGDAQRPQLVPRAMAMGFSNGSNVLFDLDTKSLRQCWRGSFARQRASGKSWYWEPGDDRPSVTARPDQPVPDVGLRQVGAARAAVAPVRTDAGVFGKLKRYEVTARGVQLLYLLEFQLPEGIARIQVADRFIPAARQGWMREIRASDVPDGFEPFARVHEATGSGQQTKETPSVVGEFSPDAEGGGLVFRRRFAEEAPGTLVVEPVPAVSGAAGLSPETITSVPGYEGVRLPLPWSIMPTAISWTNSGMLAFCSLKGEVYLATDADGDGVEDTLSLYEEGLAAPYGLIADGGDLIVAHKPELLRLRDTDGDGRADLRDVVADGWGYTDDYHDWTTGVIRDSQENLYVGTGSDYAKAGRDKEKGKWRGKVLRIGGQGEITALGHAFRYPTGLAITPDDQVFVTDNQGVQNTFNEINHLVAGAHYGVPSLYEQTHDGAARAPAIQVPHPWTRSVNGIFFLPAADDGSGTSTTGGDEGERGRGGEGEKGSAAMTSPFAGHGIGCEYDSRFLVRFTLQRVGDTYQGAVYPFSKPPGKEFEGQFRGTICGTVRSNGDIFIGSFLDSGWLGGPNIGDIVRLRPDGRPPLGIREIQAFEGEFLVSFTAPVDRDAAARPENYDIAGYTRVWQGAYATPDSGRHRLPVKSADVAADGLSVVLRVDRQQAGHVYDVACGRVGPDRETALWPAIGHYTMNRVPPREAAKQ